MLFQEYLHNLMVDCGRVDNGLWLLMDAIRFPHLSASNYPVFLIIAVIYLL